MHFPLPFAILLVLPAVSAAQNQEMVDAVNRKLDAMRYVQSLEVATGGFAAAAAKGGAKPVANLRATSAAVRSLKYLRGKVAAADAVPHADAHAAFVLACFDPKSGGFADVPGGKVDVATTAIGVMAAVELGIPKEKFAKAMGYLKDNAKTFEQVRIAAAAVEVWGVADCPFDLKPWFEIANRDGGDSADPKDGGARLLASHQAMFLRLGNPAGSAFGPASGAAKLLKEGQRGDGGWGKKGETFSDLETSYRVMRALYLLKANPRDAAKLRGFVDSCRNLDGGYGVGPGQPSTVGGVYYAAIIAKWLEELEKK